MTAQVQIRAFEREHIGAALELWGTLDEIGLSSADTPERIEQFLTVNPGLSFVALGEDALAGAVLCGQDGRRGYLYHLAVASEFRKQGIGRQLVEHALQGLRDRGILKCHLFVFQRNREAGLFWARSGWQRRDELYIFSHSLPSSD